MKITPINPTNPVVDKNGLMTQQMSIFTLLLSRLGIIIGTGSPEGVVEGIQSQLYMDDSGSAGSILYIKRDKSIGGDTTQGWILV